MKNRILVAMLSLAAFSATGCIGFERESSLTGPSAAGNGALMGNWTSVTAAANLIPQPSACSDFKWNPTEQTATSARGFFSATCGDLTFTGTAEGSFTSEGKVAWNGQANATGPGMTSCEVKLTGSAELMVDSIRIPYSGTTCLGAVSGVETLKKR